MERVGGLVEGQTQQNYALSVQDRVLMALWYYASESIYSVIGDANSPSSASVDRAIKCVTKAINAVLFQEVICFPRNMDALRLAFYNVDPTGGMPMVSGCVDGTLINIIAPSADEFQYVDRKSDHSINAMFVCGPNLRFFAASAGWRPFENAVMLGDSFYKTREYLLTPMANPQTAAERRYNVSHRKTRRVIECAYRVLKNSFLCLKRLRHKDPVLCCEVIRTCAVLHHLRTPEDFVGTLEATLNNLGLEMEAEENDNDDDDVGADANDSDGDDNGAGQTHAAARQAAQRRLQTVVGSFRR